MRLRRNKGLEDPARVPRKDRRGANPVAVGLLALLVIVLATYLGFTKHVPFTHGFRVDAVFESGTHLWRRSYGGYAVRLVRSCPSPEFTSCPRMSVRFGQVAAHDSN